MSEPMDIESNNNDINENLSKEQTLYYRIFVYGEDNDSIEEVFIDPEKTNELGGTNGIYSIISSVFDHQYTPMTHTMKIKLFTNWYTINDINLYNFCISGNISANEIIKMKLIKNVFSEENKGYNPDIGISEANKIKSLPVQPNKNIYCSLCKKSSTDEFLYNRLLKMYGPFRYKNRVFYAHFLCLIFIPEIQILDNGSLKNPGKNISYYVDLKCALCGEKGASICCCYINLNEKMYSNIFKQTCKNRYHYLCALKAGCQLNIFNYNVLCPKHIEYGFPIKKENPNKDVIENENEKINNEINNENNNDNEINNNNEINNKNEINNENNNNNENNDEDNIEKKKEICECCHLAVNFEDCVHCIKCLKYYHETCVVGGKINTENDNNLEVDMKYQNFVCSQCFDKNNENEKKEII